jgi:hypothetical protein
MRLANQRLVRVEVVQQLARLTAVIKGGSKAPEHDAAAGRGEPAELDLTDETAIDTCNV